jgi:hypothetical protein
MTNLTALYATITELSDLSFTELLRLSEATSNGSVTYGSDFLEAVRDQFVLEFENQEGDVAKTNQHRFDFVREAIPPRREMLWKAWFDLHGWMLDYSGYGRLDLDKPVDRIAEIGLTTIGVTLWDSLSDKVRISHGD